MMYKLIGSINYSKGFFFLKCLYTCSFVAGPSHICTPALVTLPLYTPCLNQSASAIRCTDTRSKSPVSSCPPIAETLWALSPQGSAGLSSMAVEVGPDSLFVSRRGLKLQRTEVKRSTPMGPPPVTSQRPKTFTAGPSASGLGLVDIHERQNRICPIT